MAETDKVTIQIDLDSGQFSSQLGNVKSQSQSTFSEMSMGALGINAALEIGHKLFEAWEASLANLEKVEAWRNQEIALKNLGETLGMTSAQVDKLVTLIRKSAGDTLTPIEAQQTAFKLLNANVGNSIPTIVKFAELTEKSSGGQYKFADVIDRVTEAMTRNRTSGLQDLGVTIGTVADKSQVLSAITAQLAEKQRQYGDSFTETASRIKTENKAVGEEFSKMFAKLTEAGVVGVFGTQLEKTELKIRGLKDELKQFTDWQAQGVKEIVDVYDGKRIPITQKILEFEKKIKEVEEGTVKAKQANLAATKELEKGVGIIAEKPAALSALAQAKESAKAQLIVKKEMYDKGLMLESDYDKVLIQKENERFKQEVAIDAQTPKKLAEHKADILKSERKHQEELRKIQEGGMKLSTENIGKGWHNAMLSMRKEWTDTQGLTEKLAKQSSNVISQGFIQMAKDHKFSMDMMLGQFVSMIGESLIQKGTADLLMSIWPPNPVGLATGAGEIALGMGLVGAGSSMGGGGGSSVAGAGSPGSASAATGGYGGLGPTPVTSSSSAMQQKSAQIIINGDFLNSRETANHLTEILRQNSDITDYAIVAQGKTF